MKMRMKWKQVKSRKMLTHRGVRTLRAISLNVNCASLSRFYWCRWNCVFDHNTKLYKCQKFYKPKIYSSSQQRKYYKWSKIKKRVPNCYRRVAPLHKNQMWTVCINIKTNSRPPEIMKTVNALTIRPPDDCSVLIFDSSVEGNDDQCLRTRLYTNY